MENFMHCYTHYECDFEGMEGAMWALRQVFGSVSLACDSTAWTVFNNNVDGLDPSCPFSHFSFLFSSACLPCIHSSSSIPGVIMW